MTTDATTAAAPTARATRRRVFWGAADQGVYGLTNIALTILVASSVGREAFGAFSAVLIVYTITIGTIQGLVSETFTVTYRSGGDSNASTSLGAAAGCAVTLGVVVAALALLASLIGSGPLVASLPAFAAVVPAMYLQDTWRFALFAMGRPLSAFLNDSAWAVVQMAALVSVRLTHHTSVSSFVLAWGAGALAGALIGMVQTRTVPQPLLAWRWIRDQWGLGGRFAGEFLTLFGAAQLVLVVLGVAGGFGELARLRAGQVLFAPMAGLLNAVRLAVTSLAVQVWAASPRRLGRFTVGLALTLGAAAAACGAGAMLLPASIGRHLLGASWAGVGPVLLPLAVLNASVALSLASLTALRALRASRESFRVRAWVAILVLVAGSVGALWAGASGAAWGLATATTIGLVLITWVTRRTLALRLRDEAWLSTPAVATP